MYVNSSSFYNYGVILVHGCLISLKFAHLMILPNFYNVIYTLKKKCSVTELFSIKLRRQFTLLLTVVLFNLEEIFFRLQTYL